MEPNYKAIEENLGLNRQRDNIKTQIDQIDKVNAQFHKDDIETRE